MTRDPSHEWWDRPPRLSNYLGFRVLVLCGLLSLPLGTACAAGSMNISQELDAEYSYVGGVTTHAFGKDIGSVSEQYGDIKYVLSPQVTKDLLLRFGFEWQRFSFGVSDNAAVPDALQQVSAVIGADYELTDQWLMRLEVQPGVYSEFSDVNWRNVDAPVVLGGVYLVDADLQWTFGLRVDPRSQYPVLPGLGVRWKFADAWTLNLMPPHPRLEYEVSDRLQVYGGADIESGTFRVAKHFGSDHGQPKLDGAPLDYSEIRFGAGMSWKAMPSLTVEAEAGFVPYRQFDFFHESAAIRNYAAPYGQIACHARF